MGRMCKDSIIDYPVCALEEIGTVEEKGGRGE
jgi:hypothetical protein